MEKGGGGGRTQNLLGQTEEGASHASLCGCASAGWPVSDKVCAFQGLAGLSRRRRRSGEAMQARERAGTGGGAGAGVHSLAALRRLMYLQSTEAAPIVQNIKKQKTNDRCAPARLQDARPQNWRWLDGCVCLLTLMRRPPRYYPGGMAFPVCGKLSQTQTHRNFPSHSRNEASHHGLSFLYMAGRT